MAKRRGHGEGTITKRKDGRWEARIDLGFKDGKRHRRSFYGKTRNEVRSKITTALAEHQQGLPVDHDRRLTVGAFLLQWLGDVKPRLAPKTYRSYSDTVRLHIVPDLGRVKLLSLTPKQVQDLLNDKQTSGLSPRSVAYIRTVLRIALGRALKWGLVSRNVAALVDAPRQQPVRRAPFTPDEARRFLDAVAGDRLEALFTVALALGLRQGEALGLRWSDIDLDARELRVEYALQRIDGRLQLKAPKTEASRRTISLPEVCVAALRRRRVYQLEDQLAADVHWSNDLDLVFTTAKGTPLDPGNVYKRFKRTVKVAGLPEQRFHDLRHCCASLLAVQQVPMRLVMEILGHSQMATTADLYSHMFEEAKRDAAQQLDQLFVGNAQQVQSN